MNTETLNLFHEYYENLVDAMTRADGYDDRMIRHWLAEICKLFGICKGVTVYYLSPLHEKQGKGEVLIPFDNGVEGKVLIAGIDQTVESALRAVVADTGRDLFLSTLNNDLALAGKNENCLTGSIMAMPTDGCTGDEAGFHDAVRAVVKHFRLGILLAAAEIFDHGGFHILHIDDHNRASFP